MDKKQYLLDNGWKIYYGRYCDKYAGCLLQEDSAYETQLWIEKILKDVENLDNVNLLKRVLNSHDCELLKETIRLEIETAELKKRLNKIGFIIDETK